MSAWMDQDMKNTMTISKALAAIVSCYRSEEALLVVTILYAFPLLPQEYEQVQVRRTQDIKGPEEEDR